VAPFFILDECQACEPLLLELSTTILHKPTYFDPPLPRNRKIIGVN
jgi:hypothetical protein